MVDTTRPQTPVLKVMPRWVGVRDLELKVARMLAPIYIWRKALQELNLALVQMPIHGYWVALL